MISRRHEKTSIRKTLFPCIYLIGEEVTAKHLYGITPVNLFQGWQSNQSDPAHEVHFGKLLTHLYLEMNREYLHHGLLGNITLPSTAPVV